MCIRDSTYMMGLSEENFTNTNKNFAKVTFHVIDGSLVIEKRNLVLTSASAQKVYNGTELTCLLYTSITASQEKVTVTITGHTNTEKYDGTPKKAEGYDVDITSGGNLYKKADFSFSGTAEVEKTDAAETAYPMGLAAGQFTNTNTNFANVEFVVTDGALTITPRQVILTSATDEKVYDGTPLTNHNAVSYTHLDVYKRQIWRGCF